jgi:hypothetical protein
MEKRWMNLDQNQKQTQVNIERYISLMIIEKQQEVPQPPPRSKGSKLTAEDVYKMMKSGEKAEFTDEDKEQILNEAKAKGVPLGDSPIDKLIKEFEENKSSWADQMGLPINVSKLYLIVIYICRK